MNNHRSLATFFTVMAIGAVLASTGCQGQTDKDTIGAAPPTAPNAKAPAPVTNKPGPAGGEESASGGGGGAGSATAETVPAPVNGP